MSAPRRCGGALGRGWTLVLPQVVSTRPEPLTSSQRLVAAVLEAGLAAMVTGHHACSWHGLTSTRVDRPVEVLVPMTQAARRVGFITVRRTRRLDVCALRRPPLIVASRARSVIDAARSARSDDEARAVVIEAAQRRLVQLSELEHEVEAGATRDSARARRALRDVRAGAWSVPEAQLLELCAGSAVLPAVYAGLELEARNGTVLVSPDVWVDDIAMALMVHSRAHHARDADWEGTVEQGPRSPNTASSCWPSLPARSHVTPDGYSAGSSGPTRRHLAAVGSDRRCGWPPAAGD